MKVRIAIGIIPLLTILALQTALRAQPTKSVWDGVYTEEQATRGKTGYSEQCASCHGPELTGGEMAPALSGGEFMAGGGGLAGGDLFGRIRISMPQKSPRGPSGAPKAGNLAVLIASDKVPRGQTALCKG